MNAVRPKGGQYSSDFIALWVRLVIEGGVSMHGVQRVLDIVGEHLNHVFPCPHFTTGRGWLLRLGLAELRKPLPQADDWILIADHSVQIGKQKLLAVAGVRASQLPPVGQALTPSDLQLISLVPMTNSNAVTVHEALKAAAKRIGVPKAIISDHGADLVGGIRLWRQDHPETREIYDIAHKAACLLKARLEADERWERFVKLVGKTRVHVAQTELAGLLPPSLRAKARFMNVAPLIAWGLKAARLLEKCRAGRSPKGLTAERVEQKLQGLDEFPAALREWNEWMQVVEVSLDVVRTEGHSLNTPRILDTRQSRPLQHASSEELASKFHEFVIEQWQGSKPFDRLPGSSEPLESIFGRFKTLERQQSGGGFTGLILSIGNLVGQTKTAVVEKVTISMETTCFKSVLKWIKTMLGTTVSSQRRTIFQNTN